MVISSFARSETKIAIAQAFISDSTDNSYWRTLSTVDIIFMFILSSLSSDDLGKKRKEVSKHRVST